MRLNFLLLIGIISDPQIIYLQIQGSNDDLRNLSILIIFISLLKHQILQQIFPYSNPQRMGNQLEKQYNIKSKPLKLPGAYTFLRFTYHPTLPQSIFIIKYPHKATLMQSSTLILPILQIKDFSSSNDSFAISPKCVPLALLKPKSQTEMKILMYKILKTGSQIGRCFLAQGRVMVWCEEKRSLSCMAPEEIEHGKYSERSKVFTSGVSLLNFLAAVHEERPKVTKKQDKKKKSESKSQKPTPNQQQQKQNTQPQTLTQQQVYNAQTLPQQIKLFFDPKQPRQYFQQLQGLAARLQHTKFWQSVSEGLRQLIMNMLSREPSNRVELDTILGIPYFQSAVQVKLYFMLADGVEGLEKKEQVAFMRALEMIVKIGTVIEQQILEEYFVPVLVSMATQSKSQPASALISHAVSILIQTPNPPLQVIFTAFRKSPASETSMALLCLQKKQKLYFLFQQQRFDSIMSRMLFCSYQSEELVKLAVMSTPFVMQSIKEDKFRKEVQFKLVTRVLAVGAQGVNKDNSKDTNLAINYNNKANEQLLICGLKCAISLIKHSHYTSLKPFTQLTFHPLPLSLQCNIHILYLYRLLTQNLATKLLFPLMMPKLQPFLSQPQISDQLFTTAHKLAKKILDRLYEQRKITTEDDIQLEYSQEYFSLKDELSADNKVLQEECKKLKLHIEKQQYSQIGWIATQIF